MTFVLLRFVPGFQPAGFAGEILNPDGLEYERSSGQSG